MKYKKKEKRENSGVAEKSCMTVADYAKYSKAAAYLAALQRATSLITPSVTVGGCTWKGSPELRAVSYSPEGGGMFKDFGPEPLSRCEDDRDALETPNFSLFGCSEPEKRTVEYTPGGTKPPCQGGVEGTCAEISESKEYAQGSQWQPAGPGDPIGINLIFEYRTVFSNCSCSGSKKCGAPPNPTTWQQYSEKAGQAQTESQERCTTKITDYDCCCNCGKKEVPQLSPLSNYIPGLSPCPSLVVTSQQQIDAIKSAIEAALLAGACTLAAVLIAQALAVAAVPVAAGCAAMYMITLDPPCQDTGGGGS